MIVLRSFKSLLNFYLKMLLIAERSVESSSYNGDLFISPFSSVSLIWCGQKLMSLFSFWALTQKSAALYVCFSQKYGQFMNKIWSSLTSLLLGISFCRFPPFSSCSSCCQIYLVFFQVSKTEYQLSLPSSKKP